MRQFTMRMFPFFVAVISLLLLTSCEQAINEEEEVSVPSGDRDFRQEIRDFVKDISAYAKRESADFIIIPQNGHTLLTYDGGNTGTPVLEYIGAIDGIGREDLFYGYDEDDIATPALERDNILAFMDIAESNNVEVLTIDYCSTVAFIDISYSENAKRGYISFAADHRYLDNIPAYPSNPFNVNAADITSLVEARNFLYLINPGPYPGINEFLTAIRNTDYDILIIDAFYEDEILSFKEIDSLKRKANGGMRLVIAYMSIGEAEDYRYYWREEWGNTYPQWLVEENPYWQGNYKVEYWDAEWQEIVFGKDDSYLDKILDAGFDGVYLDIIDAFEYFEDQ